MAKNKRQYKKVEEGVIEVRSGCPACGSYKVAKHNGTQDAPGYDLHMHGEYIGRHVKTRREVCICGQSYYVKIVEQPAKKPHAKKHSPHGNVSEATS